MNKSYTKFVSDLIVTQEIGKPIYLNELGNSVAGTYNISSEKAVGAVSVACKRIMDRHLIPELRFYQKGIFYLTSLTPFGETGIDKEQLIEDKYLKDNTGYETGLLALHRLGLTTQLPNKRVLATNNAGNSVRTDKKLGVIVRQPKVKVNAENKLYLKILDVLDILDEAPVDADDPYSIIREYIDRFGLEYRILLAFANNYYNRKTILQLARVAGGEI